MPQLPDTRTITVMGPSIGVDPIGTICDPPRFNKDTDKFKWRSQLRTYAELLKTMAHADCKKSKARLKAMGYSIYLSVDNATRNKLDRAIRNSQLSLKPNEYDLDQ